MVVSSDDGDDDDDDDVFEDEFSVEELVGVNVAI